ncbi:MAG: hypothetical protein Q9M22_05955, partial [Mariprofundaceae bacterium]|nr:hypothetical protein [Mariprofundaceae bacterium]
KLHAAFSEYADKAGIARNKVSFEKIRSKVDEILRVEADKEGRIEAWITAINNNELFKKEDDEALYFSKNDWKQQKNEFKDLDNSADMTSKEVYQFHQAAIYHRDYTLKNLLPKHGIVVL